MRCSQCEQELREGARYCDGCGVQTHVVAAVPEDVPVSLGNGRYHVIGEAGDGVRKRVYRARDTLLDREVAVALLHAEGLDDAERTRIEREIRMLARLGSHPNIVTLYDVEDLDGHPGIVFEYVSGGNLHELLRSTGGHGLPIRDVLRIGEQVARALEAVHREQIVFRDVKSANVLLAGDGSVKLCDFGYAMRVGSSRVTDPNLTVGSLAYLPPERIARRHFDHRSDLYSLGVLIYEMLAGHPPFESEDVQEIGAQHLHAEPPSLADARPDAPEALVVLVGRMLAKGVAERPESAAVVAAELARIRADL